MSAPEPSSGLKWTIIWLLVGTAVFLVMQYVLHESRRPKAILQDGTVVLIKGQGGHYYWDGQVNGHPVEFLIDTGASMTSVSEDLAEQAGLQGQRSITMHTAAGAVEAKLSEADIELKGMGRFERLQVVILPTRDTTAMVGMNVLGKLHIQQQEGQLRLKAATPSDASR
jgi:aspartyl protease family protein